MSMETVTNDQQPAPQWQPLNSRQRRVLGVLIEKAKTTPDAYPMTLNSLVNGCNQKSNRAPQMSLTAEEVEEVLEQLREMHAVTEIQGDGRVPKYRHRAYEWLGVDKTECAVMAELLLRGEQTLGDLRGRAARMEPIADLSALKPIVRSLMDRKLMIALTPEGRGQIVSHGLNKDRELAELQTRVGHTGSTLSESDPHVDDDVGRRPAAARQAATAAFDADALRVEVEQLRDEVAELRDRLEKIEQLVQ